MKILKKEEKIMEFEYLIRKYEDYIRSTFGDESTRVNPKAKFDEFFINVQDQIKLCLIAIVFLTIINYLLFNSTTFTCFIHRICPFITDYSFWKIGLSSFIGFTSLFMQLQLLYRVSNVAMKSIRNFLLS